MLFHIKLVPNFSAFDPLTLRKEVDLHLISVRNKPFTFFSAAQSLVSCIFTHVLRLSKLETMSARGTLSSPHEGYGVDQKELVNND